MSSIAQQNGEINGNDIEVDSFTEASMMLSSALEQLDDIIASSNFTSKPLPTANPWAICNGNGFVTNGSYSSEDSRSPPSDIPMMESEATKLTQQLAETIANSNKAPDRPDFETVKTIVQWLVPAGNEIKSPSPSMSTVSCPEYGDLQDKLQRLESNRESLSLQVTVLAEQVGAQTEKIKDLELLLDDKRHKLDSTEEMLHEELVSRRTLETNKLDLMSEVSNLKLKFASLERDKIETETKLRLAQNEIEQLQKFVHGKPPAENNEPTFQIQSSPGQKSVTIAPGGEIEQLRLAVQQLMTSNAEKEQQLDQLRLAMEQQYRYSRYGSGPSSAASGSGEEVIIGSMPRSISGYGAVSEETTTNAGEFDLNQQLKKLLAEENGTSEFVSPSNTFSDSLSNWAPRTALPQSLSVPGLSAVQSSPSYTSSLSTMSASSFGHTWSSSGTPKHVVQAQPYVTVPPSSRIQQQPASPAARQLAAELNQLKTNSPNSSSYSTGSLPRNLGSRKAISTLTLPSKKISGEWRPPRPPFKLRGFNWLKRTLRPNKRSTSAPNLADSDDETLRSTQPPSSSNFKRDKKYRSFRDLIGKIKRSSSQELRHRNVNDDGQFSRGVLTRATASARIGQNWSTPPNQHLPIRPPMTLFVQWDNGQICDWMNEVGLNQYVPNARQIVQSGRHLFIMTQNEMEKDLGMKNPLHRKKLKLALRSIERGRSESQDRMDFHQVLRWLDDIGLPQFRDVFAEALIDGQMLVELTVDDLLQMKITHVIHHATLSRGIELLRALEFNLSKLQRKFNPEVIGNGACPGVIELWSQHCVSEWLKTIDLTEFTPNLMCAGIHGALIVLEPTFTAESLAEILQIPVTKTLIRRHLATHFNELIGQDIVSKKREILAQSYVLQITPGLKVKALKKGFSLSRKRSKSEVYAEPDELICPQTGQRAYGLANKSTDSDLSFSTSLSEFSLDKMASSNV